MTTKYKLLTIAAISMCSSPSIKELERVTGMRASTIKWYISRVRSEYHMDIRFIRIGKGNMESGFYFIYGWGVINRTELAIRFQRLSNGKIIAY